MSSHTPTRALATGFQACRFANAYLRLEDFTLLWNGRQRPCSRKAFELIWALAQMPRKTFSRDALIEAVWPGGQVVADEALTQVVFRARVALGPAGDLIKTVRGV
ncbi:MAG: winged helix-turn-helix transcriptional regulator, partial [Xanthomonadales bacterium]|nr:winged helix-turn-helix transcriptional regulator [Xanthomonadales bacterium]